MLYVAMGTIATLGEAPACRPLHPPCLAGNRTSAAILVWALSLSDQHNVHAPCLEHRKRQAKLSRRSVRRRLRLLAVQTADSAMAPVANTPDEAAVLGLNADWVFRIAAIAGVRERQAMASAFAAMPAKVLWRLSPSEVPDEAALAELGIGNNTKVLFSPVPLNAGRTCCQIQKPLGTCAYPILSLISATF